MTFNATDDRDLQQKLKNYESARYLEIIDSKNKTYYECEVHIQRRSKNAIETDNAYSNNHGFDTRGYVQQCYDSSHKTSHEIHQKYGECGQPKINCVENSAQNLGIDVSLFSQGMEVSDEIILAMANASPKLAVAYKCFKSLEENNRHHENDHIYQKYNDLAQNKSSAERKKIHELSEREVDHHRCEKDYNSLSKWLSCAFTGYISGEYSNKIASELFVLEGKLHKVDPSKLEQYKCKAVETIFEAFEPEIREINKHFIQSGTKYVEGLSGFFAVDDVEVSGDIAA